MISFSSVCETFVRSIHSSIESSWEIVVSFAFFTTTSLPNKFASSGRSPQHQRNPFISSQNGKLNVWTSTTPIFQVFSEGTEVDSNFHNLL